MQTVGQVLKQARLKKKISLDEVSSVTRIKKRYLLALENGEYKKLPGTAYIKGFIKNYGEYVGLTPDRLWALFRREFDESQDTLLIPRGRDLGRSFLVITPNRLVALVVFLASTLFFLYLIRGVLSGPFLKVYSPENNFVVDSLNIKILGQTESEARLTINDQPIQLEEGGKFEVQVQLSVGINDIVIVSTNKLGRRTCVKRTITVAPESGS